MTGEPESSGVDTAQRIPEAMYAIDCGLECVTRVQAAQPDQGCLCRPDLRMPDSGGHLSHGEVEAALRSGADSGVFVWSDCLRGHGLSLLGGGRCG